MAGDTHYICASCWNIRHEGRAIEGAADEADKCCFCGEPTTSGLCVRYNPSDLSCKHRSIKRTGIVFENVRCRR